MEVMSDMVLESAPLEGVGGEELPALAEMESVAEEFAVEEPVAASPAPEMELPDEAVLSAEADEEELQIMAAPPDDADRLEEAEASKPSLKNQMRDYPRRRHQKQNPGMQPQPPGRHLLKIPK